MWPLFIVLINYIWAYSVRQEIRIAFLLIFCKVYLKPKLFFFVLDRVGER